MLEYARKYYPDTLKDFNEASFGRMMVDEVSYIGDILSFYLDYQASESFLDTAIEYDNIVRHARQLGYKIKYNPSSLGTASFYILVPAVSSGVGPDSNYFPILRRFTQLQTSDGNSFLLNEDIIFNDSNEIVVGRTDPDTGVPTYYAVKATAEIISGELLVKTFTVDEFRRFLKIEVGDSQIAEIISVIDADGNEYFEVDNLGVDVLYKAIINKSQSSRADVPNILKPFSVPRRFEVVRENNVTYLQFGYGSSDEIEQNSIAEPNTVSIDLFGRDYISDTSIDPTKLISTDKFGVSPSNTTLTVVYRRNSRSVVNASVGSVNSVVRPIIDFNNPSQILNSEIQFIINSIEVNNEEPIVGDISIPSSRELKMRARNYFSTQKRAVTLEDYKSICYALPAQFGALKRVNVYQDSDSFKRNLNLFVVAEDSNGNLTSAPQGLKDNLKTWLNEHKMINDTIDIIDARIVNFAVDFKVVAEPEENKLQVLQRCINRIDRETAQKYDIGEPIRVSNFYNVLNEVDGVEDVVDVRIILKTGSNYETTRFNFDMNTTPDGRLVKGYENIIFELRFPEDDITGSIL